MGWLLRFLGFCDHPHRIREKDGEGRRWHVCDRCGDRLEVELPPAPRYRFGVGLDTYDEAKAIAGKKSADAHSVQQAKFAARRSKPMDGKRQADVIDLARRKRS